VEAAPSWGEGRALGSCGRVQSARIAVFIERSAGSLVMTGFLTRETASLTREAAPVTREVGPSTREAASFTREVAPSTTEAASLTREVAPSTTEAASLTREVAPSTREAVSFTREVAPDTAETASFTRETTVVPRRPRAHRGQLRENTDERVIPHARRREMRAVRTPARTSPGRPEAGRKGLAFSPTCGTRSALVASGGPCLGPGVGAPCCSSCSCSRPAGERPFARRAGACGRRSLPATT
jgi:hypothetical protein